MTSHLSLPDAATHRSRGGRPTGIIAALTLTVLALLAVPLVVPIAAAQACACGAFSPQQGGSAAVPAETALIVDAGHGKEDIYLSLTLDSDVRSGALLFPVPDKHATVSAGPRTLFADLDRLTQPQIPTPEPARHGNGAGAAAPSVVVEHRQAIGPLDVVTLTSTDAGALSPWLTRHGFAAKPVLATSARWFVQHGWAFVAVRLRPSADTGTLDGQLDPLRVHFATRALVYPMRLSHYASEAEQVRVYTLAAHRLDLRTADAGMRTVWARQVRPADVPPLGTAIGRGAGYLTRFDGLLTPAAITDDFHFAPAASDATLLQSATTSLHTGIGLASHANDEGAQVGVVVGIAAGSLLIVLIAALVLRRRRAQIS